MDLLACITTSIPSIIIYTLANWLRFDLLFVLFLDKMSFFIGDFGSSKKNVWNQKQMLNDVCILSVCNRSLHLLSENEGQREKKNRKHQNKNTMRILNYLRVKSPQGLAINLFHFCFSNMVTIYYMGHPKWLTFNHHQSGCAHSSARYLALFSIFSLILFRNCLNWTTCVHWNKK